MYLCWTAYTKRTVTRRTHTTHVVVYEGLEPQKLNDKSGKTYVFLTKTYYVVIFLMFGGLY